MNEPEAAEVASALRTVVPAGWVVEARNTEIRPGKDARYKVVAYSTGMTIVAHPDNGKFYVTVDNGPGMAVSVSARSFGERGFDDAATAFFRLMEYVAERHARVAAQYNCLTAGHPAGLLAIQEEG